jgi:3-dehydroquinate synthase
MSGQIALAPREVCFTVHDEIALPDESDRPVEGRASRSDSYPIFIERSHAAALERLLGLVAGAKVALVADERVLVLHGAGLLAGFREAGVEVELAAVPAGERSKSLHQALRLWDWLARSSIARRDVVVTLGGGVVTDLGGFVASAYMRGLPYVNVPTTLLAQVDGALGGKVAVNHELAKNLIGAFYQPLGVVSNVAYLETLDGRHLSAGLAESIKKAVIASPAYWDFLEEHAHDLVYRDAQALEQLVLYASAIKTALIERDPYEEDLRRPLNFGHTIGHPLETVTGYGPLLHGEAVAFGMVVESRIASARGLFADDDLDRLLALLRAVGLPTDASELPVPVDVEAIVTAMEKVRLIRAGSLRYVLPVAFGETVIADDVSTAEVRRALRASGAPVDKAA